MGEKFRGAPRQTEREVNADEDVALSPKEKELFDIYAKEVMEFPTLTTDEVKDLYDRIKSGDEGAKEVMINSHLRWVIKLAAKYARGNKELLKDLVQEGNLGLIRAVEKFDPERGISFLTYSAHWIKAFILRVIEKRHGLTGLRENSGGRRDPQIVSTDSPVHEGGVETLGDNLESETMSPEEMAKRSEIIYAVREVINSIGNKQHRRIAEARFLEGKTLAEIGMELTDTRDSENKKAISRERVRQIEIEVKKKLANLLELRGLKD